MSFANYINFNEDKAFTNAFELLSGKKISAGLGGWLAQVFRSKVLNASMYASFNWEKISDIEQKKRLYTIAKRDMLICQVTKEAQERLETPFFRKIKEFFKNLGQIFGVKSSFDTASDVLASFANKFNQKDVNEMNKQAEFEAEIRMAKYLAAVDKSAFEYRVGPSNKSKFVNVQPNGEIRADSRESNIAYSTLVSPDIGDVYKVNMSVQLGNGSQCRAHSGIIGSNSTLNNEKCCVTFPNKDARVFENTFKAAEFIEKAADSGNKYVIRQYDVFPWGGQAVHVLELGKMTLEKHLEDSENTQFPLLPSVRPALKKFSNDINKAIKKEFNVILENEYKNLITNKDFESICNNFRKGKSSAVEFNKKLNQLFDRWIRECEKHDSVLTYVEKAKNSLNGIINNVIIDRSKEFVRINSSWVSSSFFNNEKELCAFGELLLKNSPREFIKSKYVKIQDINKFNQVKQQKIQFITSLIKGVEGLHDCGIVHRDLKPANIVVVENPEKKDDVQLKIIDFDLAVSVENYESDDPSGTLEWMAPELFNPSLSQTATKTDIWSLGIIFFEIWFGHRPFAWQHEKLTNEEKIQKLADLQQEYIDSVFKELENKGHIKPEDSKIVGIIKSMLAVNSDARPSAKELLQAWNKPV